LSLSLLKPPGQGEWVDFADDRRRLLIYGGPVTDPLGTLAAAGWDEFELVSTPRALASAAGLGEAAARTHVVAPGGVPEASAAIVDEVRSDRLVAFGGGRVIDSAKAVAAVRGGEVAAIPTTLSGAPMTAIHRLPEGHGAATGVRPTLVIAYSDAMTDVPEPQLRATAMNALAHGSDSLFTPLADEDSRELGLRGAELIAQSLDRSPGRRDRAALALGALLSGMAVDRAGIALHHVLGQTAVRVLGTPHAETYAALLPHTMEAMRSRAPEQLDSLASALGTDAAGLEARIADLAGHRRLGELGADRGRIGEVIDVAMARPELEHMTPGEVGREDLAAILEAAW
jgi:alcohol dehydrogenase class IV